MLFVDFSCIFLFYIICKVVVCGFLILLGLVYICIICEMLGKIEVIN